jgi:hypothetical protein
VAIVIGSLGTWVTVGPFSIGGTTGGADGTMTLIVAIIALVLIATNRAPRVVAVLALWALGVGVYDTATISDNGNKFFGASVGWGLILVDLAAAGLLVWSVREWRERRGAKAPGDLPDGPPPAKQ